MKYSDIQNAFGREPQIWDPIEKIHFSDEWVFKGFYEEHFSGNDNNASLFWFAIGKETIIVDFSSELNLLSTNCPFCYSHHSVLYQIMYVR